MLEMKENEMTLDSRCFINEETRQNYLARLQWIYLTGVMRQYKTAYAHIRIALILDLIYERELQVFQRRSIGQQNYNALFKQITYGHLRELLCIPVSSQKQDEVIENSIINALETTGSLYDQVEKSAKALRKVMGAYEPAEWWNNTCVAKDVPTVEWKKLKIVIAFEKFRYAQIMEFFKKSYGLPDNQIRPMSQEISRFGRILIEDYHEKSVEQFEFDEEEKTPSNKPFRRIDSFVTVAFSNGLDKLTGQHGVFNSLVNRELTPTSKSPKNKGRGLNIGVLMMVLKSLGYNEKDLIVEKWDKYFLPHYLAGEFDDQRFQQHFSLPAWTTDDVLTDELFQQLWDYDPEKDKFMYSLLERIDYWVYEDSPMNHQSMERLLRTVLTESQLSQAAAYGEEENDFYDEDEECYAQEEEENKEVVMALLNHVYTQYPELKEHMEEIAQEYPELKWRLGL